MLLSEAHKQHVSRAPMLLPALCFLMSGLAAQRTKQPASDCGVDNCAECNADKIHCNRCAAGFDLNTDKTQCISSSINKSSGLSTGAIAGIAVAAVIVVGGLVGFLCWWFLCRGKA
ncbi:Variant-specific surface protein [Giardia duodenalis]|uniref:Variant-specific surface protein n=1 Tax=Giardia intestinalis TaxID=5741 RepID=V6TKV8_GIAIN|nr:Variant-specific surface protein [Giardia intestinalis]